MEKFNLMQIIKLAVKNIFILILVGIVCASATFGYCKFIATPKYSATGSLLVTNGAIMSNYSDMGTTNNTDIVASINLVETVSDILNTNGIYKLLAEELDGEYTYENLRSKVSVKRKSENSLFINISFSDKDPEMSIKLVNNFLSLAPSYINEYVPNSEVAVSYADASAKTYPQTFTLMVMATMAGMIISFLVLFLINSTNTIIKDEDSFAERFGIPVLGNIPDFEKSRSDKYSSYNYGYGYGYGYSRRRSTNNGNKNS